MPPRGPSRWALAAALLVGDVAGSAPMVMVEPVGGMAKDLAALRPTNFSPDAIFPSCALPAGGGRPEGVCVDNVTDLQANLPFCGSVVTYRACVPARHPLFPTWGPKEKDEKLSQLFKAILVDRVIREANRNLDLEERFKDKPECPASLRNVLCWHNFPKCDDDDRSLPLCESSCERFYTDCGYDTLLQGQGLPIPCQRENVNKDGLFESGSPGPDQRLGNSSFICRSTEDLVDAIDDAAADEQMWIFTSNGKMVLAIGSIVFAAIAYQMLMPSGLRAYISWASKQVVMWPVEKWRAMPLMKGRTVLFLFLLCAVGFIAWGIARRGKPGQGLDRYPDANAEVTTTTVLTMTTTTTTTTDPLAIFGGSFNLGDVLNISNTSDNGSAGSDANAEDGGAKAVPVDAPVY